MTNQIAWNRFPSLCVDHDHVSGEVRGILCSRCNRTVGWLEDDPGLFARAAGYLTGDR